VDKDTYVVNSKKKFLLKAEDSCNGKRENNLSSLLHTITATFLYIVQGTFVLAPRIFWHPAICYSRFPAVDHAYVYIMYNFAWLS
jgi:hypothetical protein